MSKPIILYREFDMPKEELDSANKHFECISSRMLVKNKDVVIGRYSVLPFYREQDKDIRLAGAKLINTTDQHNFVADLRRWYDVLKDATYDGKQLTPRTWYSSEEMIADQSYNGPYVVKGITNSKKHLWKTHMFAENKKSAIQVMLRLQEDALFHTQPIVFREYVPLKQLAVGLNGMPIVKEFRLFFCRGELLVGGFYWSSHVADLDDVPDWHEIPTAFLDEVNGRIKDHVSFYVVDIAQTADEDWIVVELNDGQMSGTSECDLDILYGRLSEILNRDGAE